MLDKTTTRPEGDSRSRVVLFRLLGSTKAKRWAVMPRNVLGIVAYVGSVVCFFIESVATKNIGDTLHVGQVALVRSATGLLFLTPFILRFGVKCFATRQIPLHVMRGLMGAIGLWVYFYAFAQLPLADATAITYAKVLFLTALSAILLGEAVTLSRWLITAMGFVGVVFVVRPSMDTVSIGVVAAVVSAFLSAALLATTKILSREDSLLVIVTYAYAFSFLGVLAPGLVFWTRPEGEALFWLAVIAGAGPLGQFLGICAFRWCDASVLAPFDYLRLVLALIVGISVFGEIPDCWSVLGILLILGSTAYSGWTGAKAR
ncbi:MAG: DMT family transporter [Pirellulales bacterium]|nr:DMT family transporter [Pirellulales bacterium]